MAENIRLTNQQQRLLKLVYKFRFVTIPLLAKVLEIRHDSTYEAIESIVKQGLIIKVYKEIWRIDRRPAYYYLSKEGVTAVRKLLELDDKAVNSLYQDYRATDEFINECLATLACYVPLKQNLPPDTAIRTKTEINRFKMFPKYRPNMYIKTPDGQEAFIVVVPDKLPYFVNKRLDEYLEHGEDDGWRGKYPTLAFVVKDIRSKNGFLFKTNQRLENLGMDESDIAVLATSMDALLSGKPSIWGNAFNPTKLVSITF